MSIKLKPIEATKANVKITPLQDLKDTLVTMDHVEKVYFDKKGNHYFNVVELIEDNKKTGRFFGYLDVEVVADLKSKDKKFKRVSVPNSTEIVETLTAKQVMNFEPGKEVKKDGDKKE